MPSHWLAVGAETDPLRRARQLQKSWERLLADGRLGPEPSTEATAELRPTIVESWRRSLATGLDPADALAPIEADESDVLERWFSHPLGSLSHVLIERLRTVAEESRSIAVLTDESGLVLHRLGDEWLKEQAAEMNLVEGAQYSEAADGTNGIGTALAADHAFQVFAFEHFNERHHDWICTGAPVHDPMTGETIGVIDFSSLWRVAHPRSLELVTSAARTIEQYLLEARLDHDARLRHRYGDLMLRSTDLLVNRDGYILAGDALSRSGALDVPDSGGEVVLGDGSVAVAAPLGQGEAYLLRRVATHNAHSAPAEVLERAEEHVRELAAEQAALRSVATLVARESRPDQLFAAVAEQVARVFDVPHVRLIRYEPAGSVVVAGFSKVDRELFPLGSRWPPETPGVMRIVRETGRPARVEDYAVMPGETAAIAHAAGLRSAVASPIVVERRLWGAMVVFSLRDEPFPESTEDRLTDFTELVATAIANAESHAAVTRLADEQAALRRVATLVAQAAPPREVVDAVTEEVGRLFDVGSTTLGRYEPDGTVTTIASWSSTEVRFPAGRNWPTKGTNVAWLVLQTGEAARIDDFSAATDPIGVASREAGYTSAVGSPIVVEGRLYGLITATSAEGPLPTDAEERLTSFTELVATAIANAKSSAELAASRRRIVAAADEARRRIERDLHDGIQQRLIALTLRARAMARRAPDELPAIAEELAHGLREASDELREVSRGIHPTILTEAGLGPALRALARRSTVPVDLDLHIDGRLPEPVETAAYYIVSEALTNVAKHAHATAVTLTAAQEQHALMLEIRDDGIGGVDTDAGSGIIGLTDRAEALGGGISITSSARSGTALSVRLPVNAEAATSSRET